MKEYLSKAYCALQADRRGVTALEYVVVTGAIVTALTAGFTAVLGGLQNVLTTIGGQILGSG